MKMIPVSKRLWLRVERRRMKSERQKKVPFSLQFSLSVTWLTIEERDAADHESSSEPHAGFEKVVAIGWSRLGAELEQRLFLLIVAWALDSRLWSSQNHTLWKSWYCKDIEFMKALAQKEYTQKEVTLFTALKNPASHLPSLSRPSSLSIHLDKLLISFGRQPGLVQKWSAPSILTSSKVDWLKWPFEVGRESEFGLDWGFTLE